MNAERVKRFLRETCRDLDAGRPLKPFAARAGSTLRAALPVAVALSAGAVVGCPVNLYAGPQEPQPPREVCDDGVDNDGNGLADCADELCANDPSCLSVAEYMAVMPDEEEPGPGELTPQPDAGTDDPGVITTLYGVTSETE